VLLGKCGASFTDRGGVARRRPDTLTDRRVQHELRTAATIIRGYLRMLADGRAGELSCDQAGFVREARRQIDRMCRWLELAESRAPDDAIPIDPRADARGVPRGLFKRMPLESVVRAAAGAVRPLLEAREQTLALELEADLPPVAVEPESFERALVNLLVNAAKFSPPGSCVRVRLDQSEQATGSFLHLLVSDQGPGVAAEERERIFDPGARGSAARGIEGSGLGLAICREIVEAHGGTVEAASTAAGALFRVSMKLDEGKPRE